MVEFTWALNTYILLLTNYEKTIKLNVIQGSRRRVMSSLEQFLAKKFQIYKARVSAAKDVELEWRYQVRAIHGNELCVAFSDVAKISPVATKVLPGLKHHIHGHLVCGYTLYDIATKRPLEIHINGRANELIQTSVLIHEIAHCMTQLVMEAQDEVVADGVQYGLCSYFGAVDWWAAIKHARDKYYGQAEPLYTEEEWALIQETVLAASKLIIKSIESGIKLDLKDRI